MSMHTAQTIKALATLVLTVGVSAASAAAVQFVSPIEGVAYSDWTIVNYVDADPGPRVTDYRGGTYTYDGHDGIDYTLPNFAAMDRGVSVYAAAGGTVVEVHDGEFDKCSRVSPCGNNPNYITIDHGNGIRTNYLHLAKNSINVSIGQTVSAGDAIGKVGSSGLSSDAHLHFSVYQYGEVVNTSQDPSRWWVDPLPYAGSQKGVLDFGMTTHEPSLAELVDRPVDAPSFESGQTAYFWANLFGTKVGDKLNINWFSPDGIEYLGQSWDAPEIHYGWWLAELAVPLDAQAGMWRVTLDVSGQVLASSDFAVAVPEPATWALLLTGLGLMGFVARRRRVSTVRLDLA